MVSTELKHILYFIEKIVLSELKEGVGETV